MNFSDEEIQKIKDEILKRSQYKDDAKNKEYIKNMKAVYEAYSLDGHHPMAKPVFEEDKKKLETKKLNEIKEEINDDSGFHDLLTKLPALEANLKGLETTNLPNNPTISQRMYTKIRGKPNNADQKIAAREKKIEELTNIINAIKTLQPIYTETTKTGGKRKTRYYKKGKKSKKRKTKKRKTRKTGKI